MNKPELIDAMAKNSGLTKKDTEKALKAFVETVEDTLYDGEKVQLVGFGTFEVRDREERKGRNPKTLEEITIPACRVPAFKVAGDFKARMNNKKNK